MDISALVAAMDRIVGQAEAQLPHADRLLASRGAWTRLDAGLGDAGTLLTTGAAEVAPAWPDSNGELYADRLRRSATTVRGWQQTLAAAGAGTAVAALADRIRATVEAIRALKVAFDALARELTAMTADPAGIGPAGVPPCWIPGGLDPDPERFADVLATARVVGPELRPRR